MPLSFGVVRKILKMVALELIPIRQSERRMEGEGESMVGTWIMVCWDLRKFVIRQLGRARYWRAMAARQALILEPGTRLPGVQIPDPSLSSCVALGGLHNCFLSFLICKMGITPVCTFEDCCEESMCF
uniref:Macaca fascicularis brain cDNA, clone: QflA-16257 n=1 Tax=Macaca fascicularis TaxID=9541 RepID=I7GKY3_MACFA|nr:unnamed protein product [Macaca fascicularis]